MGAVERLRQQSNRQPAAPGAAWVKGAALLGAATVVSKLLGTLQKIPLQNVGGDRAYGIFSVVYPLYTLILFLATAGFPLAVSALVAERMQRGDEPNARRVLAVAALLLSASGAAGCALLYFGAGTLAAWMGDRESAAAIRTVSFALLFVPLMSALRGYFQGRQEMMATAVSQVAEQFVRVGTLVAVLLLLPWLKWPDRLVAAGATFGSATGACAGTIVMLLFWFRHQRSEAASGARRESGAASNAGIAPESCGKLAAGLLKYALPVSLGAIAVPVIGIVDSFTLPRLFAETAPAGKQVMEIYGIYSRGTPLVQLVSMLAGSLAAAVVPAVAEARAAGHWRHLRYRAEVSIRCAWLLGAAASVGLAVTALPVNVMLFANAEGTPAMAVLAFTAMFSALCITTAAVLQGCGAPLLPALHLLLAAAIKTALNILLVPAMGMPGAALAGVAAYATAAALNMRAVRRLAGSSFPASRYAGKPLLALGAMALVAYEIAAVVPGLLERAGLAERLAHAAAVVLAVPAGAAVYAAAVLKLNIVAADELRLVPGAERRVLPLLVRLGLAGGRKSSP